MKIVLNLAIINNKVLDSKLRHKSWSFKEGLLFGCGLLAASFVLQFSIGNINWRQAAWPINIVLLSLLIVLIAVMHLMRRKVYLFTWFSSKSSAICSLLFSLIATVALGLITQSKNVGNDVPWYSNFTSSWPFTTLYAWLTISLGMTILKVCSKHWTWHTFAFTLNHLGLFITIVTATFGYSDIQQLRMIVGRESMGILPQSTAYNTISPLHEKVDLDFAISLKDFKVEYLDADSVDSEFTKTVPHNYISCVDVFSKKGEERRIMTDAMIEVNKPLKINDWKIYLFDFDSSNGPDNVVCIFNIVRDPWLPWVYLGIFMMLAGALTLFITTKPNSIPS